MSVKTENIELEVLQIANKTFDLGMGPDDLHLDLKEDLHLTNNEYEGLISKLEIKYHMIILDDEMTQIHSLGDFIDLFKVYHEMVGR